MKNDATNASRLALRLSLWLGALLVSAALAACGGSGSSEPPPPGEPAAPAPAPAVDPPPMPTPAPNPTPTVPQPGTGSPSLPQPPATPTMPPPAEPPPPEPPVPVPPAMTITGTTPPAGSTGVDITATLTVTLSHLVRAGSVNTASFSVTDTALGYVLGNSMLDGTSTMVHIPYTVMGLLARHRVDLGPALAGIDGETFAGASYGFTTRDGTWTAITTPASGALAAQDAQAASTFNGAWASFRAQRAGTTHLYARRASATGWTDNPVPISAGGGGVTQHHLASNGISGMLLVWLEDDGPVKSVMASGLDGPQWTGAVTLDTLGTGATTPHAALNDRRQAVAVWAQPGVANGVPRVWATRQSSQTGAWSVPVALSSTATAQATPYAAIDGDGNALVAWLEGNRVLASRYSAASNSWSAQPIVAETPPAGEGVEMLRLAMTPSGDAVITWLRRHPVTKGSLWGARLRAGATTFSAAQPISSGHEVGFHELAVDAAGNAFAVWPSDSGTFRLYASRMEAAGGSWSVQRQLSTDGGLVAAARIAVDPRGNAIVLWPQGPANGFRIHSSRYSAPTDSWGPPTLRDAVTADARPAAIGVNFQGGALGVWTDVANNRVLGALFK